MRTLIVLAGAALALTTASAQAEDKAPTPLGLWKTIDDKTGQPRGIVRVYEVGGQYFARIERSLTPGEEGRKCTACTDERKDQPFLGLVLMRNVKFDKGEYSGGDILDPNTGSVYRCNFKLEDAGNTLMVRGYLGVSLVGRTQRWLREPG
ncbi:MAG TPA: DUF2147 domain-containing protein [Burkholderiaceae bacterium]|nr:DUF2147 domain-containing protein [Burkholderiaceae bacterium]